MLGASRSYAAPPLPLPPPTLASLQGCASNRVIISFKPNIVSAMAVESQGLQFQSVAGHQGAMVFTITDGASVASKVTELAGHPGGWGGGWDGCCGGSVQAVVL